jgi:hypothetical protein
MCDEGSCFVPEPLADPVHSVPHLHPYMYFLWTGSHPCLFIDRVSLLEAGAVH